MKKEYDFSGAKRGAVIHMSDWDRAVKIGRLACRHAQEKGDERTIAAITKLIETGDAEMKSLRDMLIVVRSYFLAGDDARFVADKKKLQEDIQNVLIRSLTGGHG